MPANVLSGLRILLLEDEFLIAMDVEMLCRDHGAAEVSISRSLDELDGMADGFDVAVVDLMLSGNSTIPFAKRLAEQGRPFVFASGYGEFEQIQKEFPGVPIVGKPYSGADLIEALVTVVSRG